MLKSIRDFVGLFGANFQRRLTTSPYGILPITSVSGQVVTPENLLTTACVYQAVYVLASGVASVDFNIVKSLPQGGKVKLTDHPLADLISCEPNPDITARSLYESMMVSLLTFGNAYLLIQRNAYLEPITLFLLDPRMVKMSRNPESYELEYIVAGQVQPASEIIHVNAPGIDAINGFQPVNHLSSVVGIARALDDFAGSFFAQGCNPKGILECEGQLSAEAQANLRKSIEAIHSGAGNGNRLMILEEGMKFTPSSVAPNEAQFDETQKSIILRVAMAFNLPPTKLMIYDHTALNTLEESNLDFYNSSLHPWVDRIVQAMNKKLFTKDERKMIKIEPEEGSSLKGRLKDQVDTWQVLKNMGVLNTNEVRSKLGLPPIEGGDAFLVQANNFAPLNQVVGPADSNQQEISEI